MLKQNAYLANLATEQVNPDTVALDEMNGAEIAVAMTRQSMQVIAAIETAIPTIGAVIERIAESMKHGGRLFYAGAGTSGRLGVLDASECPPTFGVSPELVQGIIAGGDTALRNAVEGAEDNADLGKKDLIDRELNAKDVVVAISASGFAPYCIGALDYTRSIGACAVSLTCNTSAALSQHADYAIEVPTGPEILLGSTRLKAGTATKMVLNMLSTGAMVRTGHVYQNLMVDLHVSNTKLKDRAVRLVCHATGTDAECAADVLEKSAWNVKCAIVMQLANVNCETAKRALDEGHGWVKNALNLLQSVRKC